jgi:hypothetical protein
MTEPLPEGRPPARPRPTWTFLTNHGHVLLLIASGRDLTVAETARRIGITPRATLNILSDLENGGTSVVNVSAEGRGTPSIRIGTSATSSPQITKSASSSPSSATRKSGPRGPALQGMMGRADPMRGVRWSP